jgi:hypothetical protein
MKELFSLRTRKFWVFVITLLLVIAGGTAAQQQPQKKTSSPTDVPAPPQQLESELARANYDRVAASAPQIKEVLRQKASLAGEVS